MGVKGEGSDEGKDTIVASQKDSEGPPLQRRLLEVAFSDLPSSTTRVFGDTVRDTLDILSKPLYFPASRQLKSASSAGDSSAFLPPFLNLFSPASRFVALTVDPHPQCILVTTTTLSRSYSSPPRIARCASPFSSAFS
jgi:hypothetical protein